MFVRAGRGRHTIQLFYDILLSIQMALESLKVRPCIFFTYEHITYRVNELLIFHNVMLGKYYLADAGYAARREFLPPFRQTRYHLREWRGNNRPRTQNELFNLRHSSLRTTVERAFGTLKNRFKVLTTRPYYPFPSQVRVVIACCILHNWKLLNGGPDELVYSEQNWFEQYPRSAGRVQRDLREEQREVLRDRDAMAANMWRNRHNVRRG